MSIFLMIHRYYDHVNHLWILAYFYVQNNLFTYFKIYRHVLQLYYLSSEIRKINPPTLNPLNILY